MRFFASRVESGLYKNQTFITSEKRCFEDYRRVYSVRLARPNGMVDTLFKDISTLEAARELAKEYE